LLVTFPHFRQTTESQPCGSQPCWQKRRFSSVMPPVPEQCSDIAIVDFEKPRHFSELRKCSSLVESVENLRPPNMQIRGNSGKARFATRKLLAN
jgi:hypothetical protein